MENYHGNYNNLKLRLDGMVPPGSGFHRNLLFDALYSSLPRDPQVKVQIYNAEIVPGGYTNWRRSIFCGAPGPLRGAFSRGHTGQGEGW